MGRAVDIAFYASRFAGVTDRLRGILANGLPNSALSIADQIVASATTFIAGALIGRMCSKEEFGLYTIGFSLLTLLMTVQASLIATPFMIRIPGLKNDEAKLFSGSSLIHQLAFGVSVSVCVAIAGGISVIDNAAMGQALIALGAVLAVLLLRDYVRQTCFARLAYVQALTLDVLLALLQIGGLAALYLSGNLHAWTAFLVLGLACAITALHWAMITRGERRIDITNVSRDFRNSWSSGKWLLASGLVWAISMNLYAWIVAAFHGTASAGSWAAALGVMTLINPLMLGVQNYLGPRIMHANAEGGINRLRRTVRDAGLMFFALLFVFTVAMYFCGDLLVSTIYGAKYAGNGTLVVLLSLNATILTVGFAVSRGLFALQLASIDFYVNFVALACFMLFGIALVRSIGPVGAALAQIATNALATLVRTIAFMRVSKRLALEAA
ncbi:MAG: oligosaccharide flippase family protein [Candidatus Hydrogenedentes bacterium]|nr:oligosaccharide flippase family protein [Candidatus Hydrogenedentota bacterium]